MIDVVCQRASRSARDLSQKLLELAPEAQGTVNWTGARLETQDALNWASRTDKLAQLIRLEHQGVSVPPWDFQGHGADWYPRTLRHQQGRDFTRPIAAGDIAFYVQKLPLEEEWRLHFFRTKAGNIRLLRSGKKIPRVPAPHPWVRSHRLGWKISYTGGAPEDAVRQGREAVKALDLDFAAVDVGLTGEGVDGMMDAYVLELNTCPGLESGTLQLYASNILERLT
jgi:hypothetical protein